MKALLLKHRLTTALTVICGVLLLVLSLQILLLNPLATQPESDVTAGTVEVTSDVTPIFIPAAMTTYTDVLERPLFFEGRVMPALPVPAAASIKPKTPLQLTLEGIAIRSDSRIALLRNNTDNNLVQLAEGLSYQGWVLQTLKADSATFLRDDEIREIRLDPAAGPNQRRR